MAGTRELGTRWKPLHCLRNRKVESVGGGAERLLPTSSRRENEETGTSQNPASGRRGFSFNALNLFHLLTLSFRAGSAKRYKWKGS